MTLCLWKRALTDCATTHLSFILPFPQKGENAFFQQNKRPFLGILD